MSEGNGKIRSVDRSAPAIMIRVATQAGPRAIEMTFGVPLDMTVADLNAYVDKVVGVSDRLQKQGDLQRAKLDLEGAEKALMTQIEQRTNYEINCANDWSASNRQGPWKPYGNQKAQMDNWDKSIRELRDNRIPHFKNEIDKLQREISQGA